MSFPTKQVVDGLKKYGPAIVQGAWKIYEEVKKLRGKKSEPHNVTIKHNIDDIAERVNQLEQNEIAQAKLITDMAEQNNMLSQLAKVLVVRFQIAITIASISLITSILILILD